MSLQDNGWSMDDAIRRTIGATNEDNAVARVWTSVQRGRLVAVGQRFGNAVREPIPPRNITASGVSAPGSRLDPYSDILIYPVVVAPNAIDLLEGMSLKDAFWQFVLRDPEVELVGARAIAENPDLKRVYLEGWCYPGGCREWPLNFQRGELAGGRALDSPIGYLGKPPPDNVQQAADILSARYESLLALLIQGKLEAVGDPTRSRGSELIRSAIWSHSTYFFDATKGDLVQRKGNADLADPFSVRWRAVTLRRTMRAETFHVKPRISDQMLSSTIDPQRQVTAQSKAMRRVETKTTSLNACRNWLIQIMEMSAGKRTMSKEELWRAAKEKWPGTLSKRAFLSARDRAIDETGASAWAAAGAPKKTKRL
jgi:hypothetical protein